MSNGYRLIHDELKDRRGSAIGLPCVAPDCRRLADGWGLVGEASHYGEDSLGRAVRWSNDLNDYAPLCDSHNNLLDRGGDWLYCPNGHYRATFGTHRNGRCKGCTRDSLRARYADPEYRARANARRRELAAARRQNGATR